MLLPGIYFGFEGQLLCVYFQIFHTLGNKENTYILYYEHIPQKYCVEIVIFFTLYELKKPVCDIATKHEN